MNDRSIETSNPGAVHVDALPVGTRLGEFEILALLGVGGFGMVYRAFDHSLHRAVAIKEFMPSALANRTADGALRARSPADQSAYSAGLHSFVGEARVLAQFDHPSLVKVFRFWEANHTAYMVMPLYSGMTFKQARAQMRTPPPEAWLRKVLWCILGALRVLHGSQMLHRDISPDNIFLQDVGPPVLLDLGAARHAINDRDRKHTAVLKVNYAPIEQYADGDAELVQGPWSDLYSLAAVVHGCLCNDTPLPSTLRSIRDRMVPFSRVAKTVRRQFGQEYSPAFVAAISQALSLRPEDRPQSIEEFLQAMEMTAPPAGLDLFDFRTDLGDLWVEPTDQPGPGLVVPTVDLTSEVMGKLKKPVAIPPASVVPAVPPAALASAPAASARPPEVQQQDVDDTRSMDAVDTVLMEDVVDSSILDAVDAGQPAMPPGTTRYGLESERERPRPSPSQKAAAKTSARAVPGRSEPKKGGSGLGMAWLAMGGAAFVVAAAAGVYSWRGQTAAKQRADNDIITELAEPASAPASAASMALQAALAASEALEAQQALAAAAAASAASAASAAASEGVSPAFVAASDPRAASRQAARRRAAQVVVAPPVVAPEPPPPPAPEPAPPPPPPRPAPVVRLCEGTTVLTRSMCLREECRKAGNASLPACVDFRRRMEPLDNQQLAN
jgi:serine/threonine protein kinase